MKNLADIGVIKDVMSRHGFSFSKALGQNFIVIGVNKFAYRSINKPFLLSCRKNQRKRFEGVQAVVVH